MPMLIWMLATYRAEQTPASPVQIPPGAGWQTRVSAGALRPGGDTPMVKNRVKEAASDQMRDPVTRWEIQ